MDRWLLPHPHPHVTSSALQNYGIFVFRQESATKLPEYSLKKASFCGRRLSSAFPKIGDTPSTPCRGRRPTSSHRTAQVPYNEKKGGGAGRAKTFNSRGVERSTPHRLHRRVFAEAKHPRRGHFHRTSPFLPQPLMACISKAAIEKKRVH